MKICVNIISHSCVSCKKVYTPISLGHRSGSRTKQVPKHRPEIMHLVSLEGLEGFDRKRTVFGMIGAPGSLKASQRMNGRRWESC